MRSFEASKHFPAMPCSSLIGMPMAMDVTLRKNFGIGRRSHCPGAHTIPRSRTRAPLMRNSTRPRSSLRVFAYGRKPLPRKTRTVIVSFDVPTNQAPLLFSTVMPIDEMHGRSMFGVLHVSISFVPNFASKVFWLGSCSNACRLRFYNFVGGPFYRLIEGLHGD